MPTLFLVGDSTVCNYDLNVEDKTFLYPRNGYGMWLNRFFFGSLNIKNLALSGRSSLSFLSEENYQTLKSEIGEGDFLMIGFGHNDEKYKDKLRFTFGGGKLTDEKSFKFSLYENYIKLARSVSATPILCTPIVRRSENNCYVGDRIHSIESVCADGIDYPASDYSKAIRELGEEASVVVIDMTTATKTYYEKIGAEESKKLHATLSANACDTDNTHLNSYGAGVVASLFAKELALSTSELKKFLSNGNFVPSEKDRFENKI